MASITSVKEVKEVVPNPLTETKEIVDSTVPSAPVKEVKEIVPNPIPEEKEIVPTTMPKVVG